MKKTVKFAIGGIALFTAVKAVSAVSNAILDIVQASTFYNAWEMLMTGGYNDAAEHLNSRIKNEVIRAWMDRSIEEYNKSLCQK